MRLLLIDDDEPLMETLARQLTRFRFAVDVAADGNSAQAYISLFHYDLLILDVNLPDISGIALCQRLRSQGNTTPILMLTGRDRALDKVEGLNAGADDYVVKPFDLNELVARISALLRREHNNLPPVLRWGDLSLDPSTFEVIYNSHQLTLTPKEFGILELLLRAPSQIRSPAAIMESLWANEDPPNEDVIRTHVKGLRQKLKSAGAPKDLIETIYGLGYRLNKRWASALSQSPKVEPEQPSSPTETHSVLTQTWQIYGDVMRERVDRLRDWVTAASQEKLTPELHQRAQADAHKLAGSLGSFGFDTGSTLARQIETRLNSASPLTPGYLAELDRWIRDLRTELQQRSPPLPSPHPSPLTSLLILGDLESGFAQQLIRQSQSSGTQIVSLPTPPPIDWLTQVQEWFTAAKYSFESAAILIVRARKPTDSPMEEALQILVDLRQNLPDLLILMVLPEEGFSERLQAVRRGANMVMTLPLPAEQVLSAILQLVRSKTSAPKVIVVDDDPAFLAALKASLSPWPFQLLTFSAATELWSALERETPDLLVLDIEMPDTNGLELCQVLRSDPQWNTLPVLFLTHHGDPETRHQAYAMGADDLVTKPVKAEELADRIVNRLKRVQQRRSGGQP